MTIEFNYSQSEFDNVKRRLDKLNIFKRTSTIMALMKNIGNTVSRKVKFNLSGQILKVRSGKLRNSIGSRTIATNDGVASIIGSGVHTGQPVSYMSIHETGGVVTPNPPNKFLAIPIGKKAKTKAGVWRSPREFENTFVAKGIIFQKSAKGKSITPLFKLVKSITIKRRQPLKKSLDQSRNRITHVVRGTLHRATQGI